MTSANTLAVREERRQDRAALVEARTQSRIAQAEADVRLRREARADRAARQAEARAQRAARWAALTTWLSAHVVDLLFFPVIAVPGGLAWTAMAAFGDQVFGPAGLSLPAFSEGAMWTFAAATTIARRKDPDAPVWHLRLGTAVFAANGATLNFIHGVTPDPAGAPRGWGIGAVMAIVSIAGVVAHQLVTAGPRRSRAVRRAARAERAAARQQRVTARAAARRQRAISRVVARRATAHLDDRGGARLVYQPGMVQLTHRWGRLQLEDVPAPRVPWPGPSPRLDPPVGERPVAVAWSSLLPVAPMMTLTIADGSRASGGGGGGGAPESTLGANSDDAPNEGTPAPDGAPGDAPNEDEAAPDGAPDGAPDEDGAAPDGAPDDGDVARLTRAQRRAKAEALLRDNPEMTRAQLVERTGVSERTADRIRSEMPRRLVGASTGT